MSMTKDELYKQHLQEVVGIRDIDNYPEKDVERVLDRLLQCLPNDGKLYKYRSIEGQSFDYAYDGLEKGYLWLASANTLNDDMDCAVVYDPEKEVIKMRDHFLEYPWLYLDNWVKANIDQLYWPHPDSFKIYAQVMGCVDKEAGELDIKKATQVFIKHGLTETHAKQYIDAILALSEREIKKHSEQLKKSVSSMFKFNDTNREDIYVYSMSETYDSNQMWAYYANSNKGFCVEYDLNKIKNLPIEVKRKLLFLYKVTYKEELEEYTFDSMNEYMITGRKNIELLNKADMDMLSKILTKTLNWQHEKEWRFLLCNLGKNNKIFADIVSGIIVDERVLKMDNGNKLISLAKERNWVIKVRKKNRLGTGHIYEELEA